MDAIATGTNKPYKTLLVEVRPRLQSVNVFIILNSSYTSLDVDLQDDYFTINIDGKKHKVDCSNFEIIKSSLTNVQRQMDYLYFRFSTNSVSNLGGFKSEILKLDGANKNFRNATTSLKKDLAYTIKCGNCLQGVCNELAFDRILPLPSDSSNHNDWFCHAHSNSGFSNLDPNQHDIFFSHCYFHVNSSLLFGIRTTNTNIICKRCLHWLGLVVNKNTYKLWFNTVNFVHGNNIFKTDALKDAFSTITNNIHDTLLTCSKIILYCQVSQVEVNYLMVWVMERSLNIYVHDEEGKQNSEVAKVLFKFHAKENDLMKQWTQDFGVANVAISKSMMVQLVKHLYKMNSYIPKIFSMTNDFYISYITMYSCFK